MDNFIEPNISEAKLLIIFHLLKVFFVNLAFNNIRGKFFFLIFKKKLGQISESTNETIFGLQFFKKFSTKILESYGHELEQSKTMGSTQSILISAKGNEGFADLRRPNAGVAIQID